jgi:MacB-like periplasmic core domain
MLYWQSAGPSVVHRRWGVFRSAPGGGSKSSSFSYPVYRELSAHNQAMQDLFAFQDDGMNATIHGAARRVRVEMVSGNYYSGLGVRPQLGRPIQPSDETVQGPGTVVIISEGIWERDFGRSPLVLGQTITVNQSAMTIVGVNPRGFTGADDTQVSPDLFLPLNKQPVVDPQGNKRFRPGRVRATGELRLNAATFGSKSPHAHFHPFTAIMLSGVQADRGA